MMAEGGCYRWRKRCIIVMADAGGGTRSKKREREGKRWLGASAPHLTSKVVRYAVDGPRHRCCSFTAWFAVAQMSKIATVAALLTTGPAWRGLGIQSNRVFGKVAEPNRSRGWVGWWVGGWVKVRPPFAGAVLVV